MKIYFKIFFLFLLFFSCKQPDKKISSIGVSQFSLNDSWRKAMVNSMLVEAKFHKNVELTILDGEGSVDKQIEDIENLIDQKVSVLVVSPIAPKPLKAVINKALKANIPVIILDRQIDDVQYDAFIGANNKEIGKGAAEYLATFKQNLKILEIKGWAGTTPTKLRSSGFNEILNSNELLESVGVVQDVYGGKGIKESFRKFVENNADFNAVFAHTDDLAKQAFEVIKELNLENQVIFVGVGGVNGVNGGLDLIEKKVLSATMLYPTGGKEAIQTAVKIINKEKVENLYLLPSLVIDNQNVSVLKRQLNLIAEQESDIQKQQQKIAKQIELYSSQRSFLTYTLISLLAILGLLFLTLKAKKKEQIQKLKVQESKETIEFQKEEIEKIAENLRVTNEATNNFFTGVSHDFKTPVSLIISSIESLLQSDKKQVKPHEYGLIHNNSKRLLRMINELLDFKRLESNKFRLQVMKTNVYDFVHSVFLDFDSEATTNSIEFSISSNTEEEFVYVDRNLFDNVLFNVLSNAIKFTPIGGKIEVTINNTTDKVFVSVKDSGIGIKKSEQDKIFQQFFQGSNNQQTSSGIGLYLTKEYLKLHGGDIEVASEEGKGATFEFFIPKGKSHFQPEQIVVDAEISESNEAIELGEFEFESLVTRHTYDKNQETVLIIEDNTDLRLFLKNKLASSFIVHESEGIDAVQKALELVPDIIISDVNLPEKNGFEITKILKDNEKTSHIPVIILTALSSDEAHLKGLKAGVDMFLTKPFNLSVLYQSIASLLYNRKKTQHYFKQKTNLIATDPIIEVESGNPKKIGLKEIEQEFVAKLDDLITKNFDDSSFTVEVLADQLDISRVQLYRKVKALLGISVSDYIQEKRLAKAQLMLIKNELSIADIAYSVGFSSPNYFSTAFKNKHGKTPKQYQKQKK